MNDMPEALRFIPVEVPTHDGKMKIPLSICLILEHLKTTKATELDALTTANSTDSGMAFHIPVSANLLTNND
jgi:hypothetical protein